MSIPLIARWFLMIFGEKRSGPILDDEGVHQRTDLQPDLNDPWWRFMIFDYKPHGYSFRDVMSFDRVEFDTHHDFIQWLFPNRVGSPVNPVAPLLTDKRVELYWQLPGLRNAVGLAIAKMYEFLGFRETPTGFVREDDFEKGSQYWVCRVDHNHKRISRLLTFLCEMGERGKAVSLLAYLETELAEADLLGIEAILYWRAILAAPIEGAAEQ